VKLAAPYGVDPEELFQRTAGNPFFVTEVLASRVSDVPETVRDAARLAHHAEAAADVEALVEFAPAAAAQAAASGAHREAADQYARALRCGDAFDASERARLLELCAHECQLSDRCGEAIALLQSAIEVHRAAGNALREGDALRQLS
jgi:hypothetical protein